MKTAEHTIFTVTSRDGFPLSGHCWMPAQPKAVIALIHGLGEHCGRYERFAIAARAQGFAVIGLDLRGHGRSFGDRTYVERFSDYLLDADALMAKARKLAGRLPLFLMGHSMGGAVAMRWVAERQPDLAGLILSSAALKIGADVSKLLMALAPVISKFAPRLGVKKIDPSLISRDKAEVEAYRKDPLVCHLPTPARTGSELLWAIESNRVAAHIQTVPIYLFHGDADSLTDPDGSRELYAAWGCQDKTLRIWPGSRHESLNDLDKEAVMEELFIWIDVKVTEKTRAVALEEAERLEALGGEQTQHTPPIVHLTPQAVELEVSDAVVKSPKPPKRAAKPLAKVKVVRKPKTKAPEVVVASEVAQESEAGRI